MRRGDGPILFALFGVAIVTVAVRPPEAGESSDEGSREATLVASGSARTTHASPDASAACAHALSAPSAPRPEVGVTAAGPPPATPVEPLAPLVEMFGTPIVGTPTNTRAARPVALPHDRDLGGAFRADGRVTLVVLAASWCSPCAEELPVILGLGNALEAGVDARIVLVMHDAVGGPFGLAAAVDALWAKAEASSRARPAWLELRADPDAHWARWAGDNDAALPRTLLLDGQGILRARVDGPLEPAHAERLRALAEVLAQGGEP